MSPEKAVQQSSLFVPVGQSGHELYVGRFSPSAGSSSGAVLLMHGAVENGRIFYSADGTKGLAPFLAANGFDVFVADARGRGQSRPRVSRSLAHSQTDAIVEDIPTLDAAVRRTSGAATVHWIAHSWGGVLAQSCLARHAELRDRVASVTCFGTKRSISVWNVPKLIGVDFGWNRLGKAAATIAGYLPGRRLKFGSDDEPLSWYLDCIKWVDPRHPWVDTNDGFDYGAAAKTASLPRTMHLAGASDLFLGHPIDVERFAEECAQPKSVVTLLSKARGCRHDYGHIDMLTHPDAAADHFLLVLGWLLDGKRHPDV